VTPYAPPPPPDARWSVMLVNRDWENTHKVRIDFHDPKAGGERSFAGPVSVLHLEARNTSGIPRSRADSPARMAHP